MYVHTVIHHKKIGNGNAKVRDTSVLYINDVTIII